MAVQAASFDYPTAILVAMSPGWVQTDMGGPNATISVQKSVADMRRVIDMLTLKDSGSFLSHNWGHISW